MTKAGKPSEDLFIDAVKAAVEKAGGQFPEGFGR